MRKSRATPIGAPEGAIEELPSGALFGALLAPGGKVSIAPFAPGVPVALVGSGPQPPGTLALNNSLGGLNGILEVISAGTLWLTSFGAARITVSGANPPGGLTDPHTGAPSGVGTLLVNAGVTSGTIAAGGFLVIGTGGSASLFGSVAGIAGEAAAGAARMLPLVNTNDRLIGCVIQTTICAPLFVQMPRGTPNIVALGGSPSLSPAARRPSNVPFAIPAESGDNWTDAGGFPLQNVAREDD